MILRTSERAVFKRCRQRWWWEFVDGWRSKRTKSYFSFGDIAHRSFAEFYQPGKKRGPHPAGTFKRIFEAELGKSGKIVVWDEEGDKHDFLTMGIAVMEHYVERYGRDPDVEVISPEHPFAVKIRDKNKRPLWYVGRFDALIRYRGDVALFENKFLKSISSDHLQMDEQATSYWTFAPWYLRELGLIDEDTDLSCMLYNQVRKGLPDERPFNADGLFLNKDGSISKSQPAPYFDRTPVYRDEPDRRNSFRRIQIEAAEMKMVRDGDLDVYKNQTKDCHWECPLYDACELHETGSDWEEFLRQNFISKFDQYSEYKHDLSPEFARQVGKSIWTTLPARRR